LTKNTQRQQNVDEELAGLQATAGKWMEKSHCKTAFQWFGELRSRSRVESRLDYYVLGTFFQMNLAQRLLEFELTRERAVELIAIFEDEEQARKIEPQLDLDAYEGLIYSMGACAYEVLAEATGELNGFNSEGMQECLTGGIEICHRIGKLNCLQCFREYACDIHSAADDYELARFHCNQLIGHREQFADRGDRRWSAMLQMATLDLLDGQHEAAREKLDAATDLAKQDTVHDITSALLAIALERKTLDALDGITGSDDSDQWQEAMPPRDECPQFDFEVDCLRSLRLAAQHQWNDAEALLIPWNQRFKRSKATTQWLETGVRLVALQRLRGDMSQAKRLSVQFEEAATKANDWQSIRRLHRCLEESQPITPLGTVVRNSRKSTAFPSSEPQWPHPDIHADTDRATTEAASVPAQPKKVEATPLQAIFDQMQERMLIAVEKTDIEEPNDDDLANVRSEILQLPIEQLTHPHDVGRALNLMTMLISPEADREQIWKWANQIVSRHQDVSYLVSMLGRLGMAISLIDRLTKEMHRIDHLTWEDELNDETPAANEPNSDSSLRTSISEISNERLEQLVRKAIQMNPNGVKNHFRAAEVFEYIGKAGEAERCYARSFRLDRTQHEAALALSRIYAESERVQDALYVLDLCIRSGGMSRELLFEAALKAHLLTQYELQLSYLNRLHDQYGPAAGTFYYQSLAHLELKHPEEALNALHEEETHFRSKGLHIDSVRALALAQQGSSKEAVAAIKKCLRYSLPIIDDIAPSGISGALERLLAAAKLCKRQTALLHEVEHRMLRAGVATESYFEQCRANEKPCDLYLFQCYVVQELDDTWPDDNGCLFDQSDWDIEYFALWGILAQDAAQATQIALEWQRKCFHLECFLHSIEKTDQLLHDRPGVAFQGPRYESLEFDPNANEEDDDDDDDESDDFDED
jgi:tetratricopeptide (TPR) repeat protein